MSNLIFCDSFDHYSVAQGTRKWTLFPGGTLVAGRTGQGLQAGALNFPSKTLSAQYPTLTAGVAYRTASFANEILKFSNTLPNTLTFEVRHVGDGRLKIHYAGLGADVDSTPSSFVMSVNQWYYVELQGTISGSGTTITVVGSAHVNGAEVVTMNHSFSSTLTGMGWITVSLQGPGGGNNAIVDDVYVTDDEFLGDVKIYPLYPNAAGDSSTWTPNAAGANYTKVSEHPADDDTTYVSTLTVGNTDLYQLDDLPAGSFVVKGAQASWLAKKGDAGTATIRGQWKSGSTVVEDSVFNPSESSYLYKIQPARKSLFTASDWTTAEINALQLGIKRTA